MSAGRTNASTRGKQPSDSLDEAHDIPLELTAYFGKVLYFAISFILLSISIGIMGLSLWEIWQAMVTAKSDRIIAAMLDGIALTVLSLAVIDVSKYLFDEEVIRSRELRGTAEARGTLTKFLTIITIAVSLEAIVLIFKAGKEAALNTLIYPAVLLFAAVTIVISLGLYQFLSSKTQKLTGRGD